MMDVGTCFLPVGQEGCSWNFLPALGEGTREEGGPCLLHYHTLHAPVLQLLSIVHVVDCFNVSNNAFVI